MLINILLKYISCVYYANTNTNTWTLTFPNTWIALFDWVLKLTLNNLNPYNHDSVFTDIIIDLKYIYISIHIQYLILYISLK